MHGLGVSARQLLVVWLSGAAAGVEHLLQPAATGLVHAGHTRDVACIIHRSLKGAWLLHAAPQRLRVVVRTLRVLVVAAGVRVLVVARANTRIGRLLLLLTAMLARRVCGKDTRRLSVPLAHRVPAACRGCQGIGRQLPTNQPQQLFDASNIQAFTCMTEAMVLRVGHELEQATAGCCLAEW
jgi:hypothetical protein